MRFARASWRQDYASLPQKPLIDDELGFTREVGEDDKFRRAIEDMGFLYASVNTAVIEQRGAALPASLPHGMESLPTTVEPPPHATEEAHQLPQRDSEMARQLRSVLVKAKRAEQPKDYLNLRKCDCRAAPPPHESARSVRRARWAGVTAMFPFRARARDTHAMSVPSASCVRADEDRGWAIFEDALARLVTAYEDKLTGYRWKQCAQEPVGGTELKNAKLRHAVKQKFEAKLTVAAGAAASDLKTIEFSAEEWKALDVALRLDQHYVRLVWEDRAPWEAFFQPMTVLPPTLPKRTLITPNVGGEDTCKIASECICKLGMKWRKLRKQPQLPTSNPEGRGKGAEGPELHSDTLRQAILEPMQKRHDWVELKPADVDKIRKEVPELDSTNADRWDWHAWVRAGGYYWLPWQDSPTEMLDDLTERLKAANFTGDGDADLCMAMASRIKHVKDRSMLQLKQRQSRGRGCWDELEADPRLTAAGALAVDADQNETTRKCGCCWKPPEPVALRTGGDVGQEMYSKRIGSTKGDDVEGSLPVRGTSDKKRLLKSRGGLAIVRSDAQPGP